jgi:hypothetical protein
MIHADHSPAFGLGMTEERVDAREEGRGAKDEGDLAL